MRQIVAIVTEREIAQCQGDNIIPLCERVATASPLLKTFSTRLVQTESHVLALFSTEGLNHRKMLYLKPQRFLVYIIIQHNKTFNSYTWKKVKSK